MRKGTHPLKNSNMTLPSHGIHRVIIPVFLPKLEGYFEYGLEILKLCVNTLLLTTAQKTNITIIANDCCDEVIDYLNFESDSKRIDQLILNRDNHGKLDSILSVAHGCFEEYVTFADCDAFFYPGWESAVSEIFVNFPEAGWVSSQPAPDTIWLNSYTTMFNAFTKSCLKKMPIVENMDLRRFGESIGRPDMYERRLIDSYIIVKRGDARAVIGGNHFVFTIRRSVLDQIPIEATNKFIAEEEYFGIKFDRTNYWRLSTPDLKVQHMGNIPEEWMYQELSTIKNTQKTTEHVWQYPKRSVGRPFFPYSFRRNFGRIFRKLNLKKFLRT